MMDPIPFTDMLQKLTHAYINVPPIVVYGKITEAPEFNASGTAMTIGINGKTYFANTANVILASHEVG